MKLLEHSYDGQPLFFKESLNRLEKHLINYPNIPIVKCLPSWPLGEFIRVMVYNLDFYYTFRLADGKDLAFSFYVWNGNIQKFRTHFELK